MPSRRPSRSFVLDASVLIDYAKTEVAILALTSRHLGVVVIPDPVLKEVKQLSTEECEHRRQPSADAESRQDVRQGDFGVLRASLRQLYPELGGALPTAQQLGYTLRSFSGREAGGH